jgi:hypothetical protein
VGLRGTARYRRQHSDPQVEGILGCATTQVNRRLLRELVSVLALRGICQSLTRPGKRL